MPTKSHYLRTVDGIVTTDPLRNMPLGAQLHVSASLFSVRPKAGLNSIANWDFFNGAVLAVHFGDAEGQRISGSGVLVAPGVAITARHVIEAEEARLMAGELAIICSGITPDGLTIWRVHQVTLVGNADIALLMIQCASALPRILHQVTLTTRMPRVGERLAIAGIRHHATASVNIEADLDLSMMVAQGAVTARYERARDRVLLPSPCFEVDCPALGGMSGGPAFDEDGFLVGLVSSSLEGHPGGPTYLSLPWPALPERIHPCWPEGLYRKETSLLEIDRRLCGIHRPEAIQMTHDESGRPIATYHHWQ
jgi:S1-C subfamily serine protease